MVGADHGAVDHLDRLRRGATVAKPFEQQVPQARPAPAQELAIDRVPLAEFLRQIAPRRARPRHPEYTVQRAPMIARRTPAQRAAGNNEGFEKRPFYIAHQSANQNRLPQEVVLNHISDCLRIPLSTGPSLAERSCVMDSNIPGRAGRLRLRADLWRRDAQSTTNRHLNQLMLR